MTLTTLQYETLRSLELALRHAQASGALKAVKAYSTRETVDQFTVGLREALNLDVKDVA